MLILSSLQTIPLHCWYFRFCACNSLAAVGKEQIKNCLYLEVLQVANSLPPIRLQKNGFFLSDMHTTKDRR